MFRVSQHPSSGVLNTVSATSGIGHDTGTAISFQRGLVRTGVSESTRLAHTSPDQATLKGNSCTSIMTIPEVADTVFSTPYDGCCDTRNM